MKMKPGWGNMQAVDDRSKGGFNGVLGAEDLFTWG